MKIYKIKVNGKTYRVELEAVEEVASSSAPAAPVAEKKEAAPVASAAVVTGAGEGKEVPSPIQGSVVNVLVKPGDKVKKGTVLVIVEAMKLENEVVSPFEGTVESVLVTKGQAIQAKQPIATIK